MRVEGEAGSRGGQVAYGCAQGKPTRQGRALAVRGPLEGALPRCTRVHPMHACKYSRGTNPRRTRPRRAENARTRVVWKRVETHRNPESDRVPSMFCTFLVTNLPTTYLQAVGRTAAPEPAESEPRKNSCVRNTRGTKWREAPPHGGGAHLWAPVSPGKLEQSALGMALGARSALPRSRCQHGNSCVT